MDNIIRLYSVFFPYSALQYAAYPRLLSESNHFALLQLMLLPSQDQNLFLPKIMFCGRFAYEVRNLRRAFKCRNKDRPICGIDPLWVSRHLPPDDIGGVAQKRCCIRVPTQSKRFKFFFCLLECFPPKFRNFNTAGDIDTNPTIQRSCSLHRNLVKNPSHPFFRVSKFDYEVNSLINSFITGPHPRKVL